MSLAQKYRARFAAQRGSLTLYLSIAAAFHGGMMAGGIVPWQQTKPPNLTVELIQSIEFIYLEAETEVNPESDRRSNLDAIAGGEAKPDLPAAIAKPGIEESLRENSATNHKVVAPLAQVPVPSGRVVPASSAASNDRAKATETEASTKPEAAAPAQPTPEPSHSPSSVATNALGTAAPIDSNDSAFAGLPQLEPDSFLMDGDRPDSSEQTKPSESALLEQPVPSQPLDLPASTDQFAVPFEAALSLGQEFAGIANSNRTAANQLGVDAEQDAVLGEYLAQMNQQIEQQWQRIQVEVDVTRSAKVRFTVSQLGELVEWEVTQSSGLAIADQAAVQAIQRSAPFEPLPPTANRRQLTRTLTFHYSIRQPTPLR